MLESPQQSFWLVVKKLSPIAILFSQNRDRESEGEAHTEVAVE